MQSTQEFTVQKIDTSPFSFPAERRLPLGLDEFLAMWEHLGRKNKFIATEKFEKSQLSFAEPHDARAIVKCHNKAYYGLYPYHEMLDVEYVEKFVEDRESNLVGLYSHEDTGETAGCGIMNCRPEDRIGYLRGLIVIPEFQGKIDMKKICCENAALGYQHFWNTVDKWYTETRTAHSKAQFLVEYISLRPCGILPNKDVFVGQGIRESDVLEITYPNRTLYELRNKFPQLLPELRPLYDFIAHQFNLPDGEFTESQIEVDTTFRTWARKLSEDVTIFKTKNCLNTCTYRLELNNSYMEFMVTDMIQSAERTDLHAVNADELAGLLIRFWELMDEEDIQYFEYYSPATNVEYQRVFSALGFKVFAYAPAWKPNVKGTLDDCIVFGYSVEPLNPKQLHLSESGKRLWQILKYYILQN
ncbi:MAG: hypothetical protein JW776_04450 [Candidatus Lokiarchaeota archaeon]|nr:hypothetical protein [Candidatus Lokiarchaeota archaeon]